MAIATRFTYSVLGCQTWDASDDNIDVEITLSDERKYSATFFTISNIRTLMNKNRLTGECAGGIYFWAANMIVVEDLESETIRRTVAGLIKDGEIDDACYRVH
jgi:hypothetical protein